MMLLVSDFDYTLFNKQKSIVKNILAIKDFQNENIFVIATGRSYVDLKPLLLKYNIPYDYIIVENGAKIIDKDQNVIYQKVMNQVDVENTMRILTNNNYDAYFDTGENLIKEVNNNILRVIATYKNRLKAKRVLLQITNSSDVYGYLSSKTINILNKDSRKEVAISKLAVKEEILLENIHTIGDDINDLEMIRIYSGAVMKKSNCKLKKLPAKRYASVSDYIKELIKD